jgi:hypothetical protein
MHLPHMAACWSGCVQGRWNLKEFDDEAPPRWFLWLKHHPLRSARGAHGTDKRSGRKCDRCGGTGRIKITK